MAGIKHVTMEFSIPFKGIGENDRGNKVEIDGGNKHTEPYDLLLMSLGSCLYATFEDIISKKKLSYEKLVLDITGEKRIDTPTTLKYCKVIFKAKTSTENEKAFTKSMELACKYCSIYNTLSYVAEMHSEMVFT
ncbi:MAG: OsmC family protein [Spirochaetales bacterium]|nr:OsmC family protein [Spirochaetales bacterium]